DKAFFTSNNSCDRTPLFDGALVYLLGEDSILNIGNL
ncbi:hypothetical protein BMETH_20241113496, partial [methanotrophic bacterial endosymbiont of Bathymodiolus sp.]